ncbi:MAG: alpha/beta fold hydrolase [Anaerolineae bacterium]|nr:alpha/beta fold hydrolase [Anaerolineae bacterium]
MRCFVIVVGLLMVFAAAAGAQPLAVSTPLSGTQWQLVSIDGATVVPDSIVTLLFGTENDTAGGNGGCNTYGGTYTADETSISISDVFSTFIACEATLEQELVYFAALQAAERYTIRDGMLTITTSDGAELVFEPLITLAGNAWVLTNIGSETAAQNSRLTLVLNEDGTAGGNGGCNPFHTTYTLDQQTIAFDAVVSTRIACADELLNVQEIAYLAALESAHSFRLTEDGTLTIGYGAADKTLEFTTQFALAQSPAPGEVPAGLERFYDQELTFGSCEGYATTDADAEAFANDTFECARLEVPLDYENPDGRTAQIAVLRIPATGTPIGSLLLNPGGPGFSGMIHAPLVASALEQHPITAQFDLIGFDPRGVGASTPTLDCLTDAQRDADVILSNLNSGDEAYTEDETRQLYEQCAERSGGEDVLAHVGTRDAVRDMDVLRAVLGDEKLTFFGQSYGTRLGAVYAETFPQNMRAMVLDGAIDPNTGTTERRLVQFEGFQRAFENMAAFCAQSPDCPLGTDPEQATTAVQQLLQPLIDQPIVTANGRELTYTAANDGMILLLYSEVGWPVLIRGLTELRDGRGDTLLLLRDLFNGRNTDGSYSNAFEATLAIECLDEERHTPEQETAMKQRIFEIAPFMDTGRPVEARDPCEHWPVQPTLGYPYAQNIEGLPTTLIVSVTRDPATPHEGGISLAKALGGYLLTVEGEQHGVALIGNNACVNDIVADYLISLELPDEGATCTL